MAVAAQITAGGRITAAQIQAVAPLAVIKAADQSRTSSVAFVNDTALVVAVAAGASYLFTCYLDYEGGTQGASDIQWQWAVPAGTTLRYTVQRITTAGAAGVGGTFTGASVVTAGSNGAGVLEGASMQGTLVVSSTAGNLQLQWAQNTSNATATIVHAQSFLALWRVS